MTALLKALPISFALTMIFAFIVSPYGRYSDYFYLQMAKVAYFEFYWSWPVFLVLAAIGWLFFWILEWG